MKILVTGHRSFVARGLVARLRRVGHDVVCFSRGELGRKGQVATGAVGTLLDHPHLQETFEVVLNFIVLKGESVESNREYIRALLRFCSNRGVRRLIHLSSLSVYPRASGLVDENSAIEGKPARKGMYGAWKVAADLELVENQPKDLELVLARPGFVLGPGLMNPIVGNALRLPSDRLLCLGDAHATIPLISRGLVHEALQRAVERPLVNAGDEPAVLLLVNPESPLRIEYLRVCCEDLGIGIGVLQAPVPLWLVAGLGAEAAACLMGRGAVEPLAKIRRLCSRQRYDPSATERLLEMDFRFDWRKELLRSLDGQHSNFRLPPPPGPIGSPSGRVDFLGMGRIVGQRHLPALKRLNHRGEVQGWDPKPGRRYGVEVAPLTEVDLTGSDLVVVASPGPVHGDAISWLQGTEAPVIVEKPLCYTRSELERWRRFAARRQAPVYVCHNYRYKQNVREMRRHLQAHHAGRLIRVDVLFQSPPVAQETSEWIRRERKARTLLMDYSLHFIDLACMLGEGPWRPEAIRWSRNDRGETSVVEGRLLGGTHPVNFCLRQGFIPKTARVQYVFENCIATLRFFPDVFTFQRADEGFWHHTRAAWRSTRATVRAATGKIGARARVGSHAQVLGAALAGTELPELSVESLTPFYRGLLELADQVYAGGGKEASV